MAANRVIVSTTQSFTTRRVAKLATFVANSSESKVVVKFDNSDYLRYVPAAHVKPYSDALWQAWQRWYEEAETLDKQQQALVSGRVPKALVTGNLFDERSI